MRRLLVHSFFFCAAPTHTDEEHKLCTFRFSALSGFLLYRFVGAGCFLVFAGYDISRLTRCPPSSCAPVSILKARRSAGRLAFSWRTVSLFALPLFLPLSTIYLLFSCELHQSMTSVPHLFSCAIFIILYHRTSWYM